MRTAVGLSQIRLAQLLNMSSGYLSDLERTDAKIPEDLQLMFTEAISGWEKPKKRSFGSTKGRQTPQAPGLKTNCCEATSNTASKVSPTAIALFSGCGGFAKGFSDGGFDIVGFVEIDPAARASFKANFPSSSCMAHSIEEFAGRVQQESIDGIDVIIGGPPCQGFSLAGKRDPTDPRNSLFEFLVGASEKIRPKIIVMENVRLLLTMKNPEGRLVIELIRERFASIGYRVDVWVVNAADFGAPQSRERIFLVANRADIEQPIKPAITHAPTESSLFEAIHPCHTFRDATSDLEPLESGESSTSDSLHWAVAHPDHVLKWLRATPEGESAHNNSDPDLRPPSGYNTTYKRLRWDQPSSTIGTTFGMISGSRNVHPSFTRSLTVREAARCQTFPDTYRFEGTWSDIRTMIGNAVPPLLAKTIASSVRRVLDQKSTNSVSLK